MNMSYNTFSEACERNKKPIAGALKKFLANNEQGAKKTLLEIGSGTGQHAVFFSKQFSSIVWQPTDVAENLMSIAQRVLESGINNCLTPIELNLNNDNWPTTTYDYLFTANTLHIISWQLVEKLISKAKRVLNSNGLMMFYGPFNYNGQYTSVSNKNFDQWLKQRDPLSGIRDIEHMISVTQNYRPALSLIEDIQMPANNRLLVFKKD